MMKITVFGSNKTSKDGRPFTVFSTRLVNVKTGEEEYCNVRFVGVAPIKKEDCPIIIEFNKTDANMSKKRFTDKNGNTGVNNILWIKNCTISDETYVDHSLDDYAETVE